jgi:hypothetical protein
MAAVRGTPCYILPRNSNSNADCNFPIYAMILQAISLLECLVQKYVYMIFPMRVVCLAHLILFSIII